MISHTTTRVRGIVLAGVHVWQDGSLESIVPRPLLPVAHKPLMHYSLQWLANGGVRSVTLCANSASRLVRMYMGDGQWMGVRLSYYEDMQPRGPAGCVHDTALRFDADYYVVIDGSVIPEGSAADVVDAHMTSGADLTVAVAKPDGVARASLKGYSPAGIYVMSRHVMTHIGHTGYQDIKEGLIPALRKEGMQVSTYPMQSRCQQVINPCTYLRANLRMLSDYVGSKGASDDYDMLGESVVHRTASLYDGCRLYGPVMVGASTVIESGATIIGPTVIGEGCHISSDAVLCRSVLWDHCEISGGVMIDNSILTNDARIAAGSRMYRVVHTGQRSDRRPAADKKQRSKLKTHSEPEISRDGGSRLLAGHPTVGG